jgi:heat shock protein HtpX
MKMAKRVVLFLATNLLIIVTLSVVLSVLGVAPYIERNGINFGSLIAFCSVWGFGGAFLSLLMSRQIAKWSMGVQLINPETSDPTERALVHKIYSLCQQAGIQQMPEVGIYESPELNAFATGPTKNRSLVAVSSGLLQRMDNSQLSGVLAHEVTHIANGDMVTMTLLQGVVNSLVMILARLAGFFASQLAGERSRDMVRFVVMIVAEILLGMLGMIVVATYSRRREYRADAGGANLAGRPSMISALEALKLNQAFAKVTPEKALSALQISGKPRFWALFSTHPDLDDRIARLKI